jgi:5-methylcytosine-specific restriction endonuclease McrA
MRLSRRIGRCWKNLLNRSRKYHIPVPGSSQITKVYARALERGFICPYCGRTMTLEPSDVPPYRGASLDHKIPLCRGGGNTLENLVICCSGCNMKKHNMTEKEFVRMKQGVSLPRRAYPLVTERIYRAK